MKHVAFAEAEIQKSALDRACGPLKLRTVVALIFFIKLSENCCLGYLL